VGNIEGIILCEAEPKDFVGDPETRGDKKSERYVAVGDEQRVRRTSTKTTPDTTSGYPFAGLSAVCAAAELNVTQIMVLNTFMEPNFLSERTPREAS